MKILLNDFELFLMLKVPSAPSPLLLLRLVKFPCRWQEQYWRPWHFLVPLDLSSIFMFSDSFSNYSVITPFHPLSLWNLTSYFKARILSDDLDVESKLRNRFSHYSIPLVTVRWLTVMYYFYPYIIRFFPFKTIYWAVIVQVLYSFLGL